MLQTIPKNKSEEDRKLKVRQVEVKKKTPTTNNLNLLHTSQESEWSDTHQSRFTHSRLINLLMRSLISIISSGVKPIQKRKKEKTVLQPFYGQLGQPMWGIKLPTLRVALKMKKGKLLRRVLQLHTEGPQTGKTDWALFGAGDEKVHENKALSPRTRAIFSSSFLSSCEEEVRPPLNAD